MTMARMNLRNRRSDDSRMHRLGVNLRVLLTLGGEMRRCFPGYTTEQAVLSLRFLLSRFILCRQVTLDNVMSRQRECFRCDLLQVSCELSHLTHRATVICGRPVYAVVRGSTGGSLPCITKNF